MRFHETHDGEGNIILVFELTIVRRFLVVLMLGFQLNIFSWRFQYFSAL